MKEKTACGVDVFVIIIIIIFCFENKAMNNYYNNVNKCQSNLAKGGFARLLSIFSVVSCNGFHL